LFGPSKESVMAMDDHENPGAKGPASQILPPRKPWHAPQFFVAELASTFTVANGGNDGAPSAPSQS